MSEITNLIEDKKGSFSRIKISGNKVEIESLKAKTLDESSNWHILMEHEYTTVTVFTIGSHTYVEASDSRDEVLEVFSVNMCGKICTCHSQALVIPRIVSGELFLKIRLANAEGILEEQIYDEYSNLIDFSTKYFLDVTSSMFGDKFIQKRNRETGAHSLWTFEKTMITPWTTP